MAWKRGMEHEAASMHENGYRSGHVNEWAKAIANYNRVVTRSQESIHGPCTDDFPPENK